jgi:1-acyl-sn-glycerol-3-phosphate acyltransferase
VLKTLFRPWVIGLENIPATGGAILASNHLSFSDSVFLPVVVDRQVSFLAKSEYFTGKGIKGFLVRLFFIASGQLPIDRAGGKASEASLNTGLRVLARGDLLGIYPEGTRSPDAKLYRGRTGVARMVLEAHVPIIPVAMIDTEKVMPIGTKLPKIRRIGIVIGEPLDFSRFEGLESDRFILRSVTDEIMYELHRLGGQEYADVYATSVKEKRVRPRATAK